MTTFDRYLLRRFWHVFGIGFFATVGLFVVFDGFTNVDAFQDRAGGASSLVVFGRMAQYYSYQTILIFDLVGAFLNVVSTMVVFALLQKNREIHPILSAGVPTIRLLVPMLVGALTVSGLLMLNQEFVLPALAGEFLKPIGTSAHDGQPVKTRRDFSTHIEISGQELILDERKLRRCEFLLPAPEMVSEITRLKAEEAVYRRRGKRLPAGWHLKQVSPRFADLRVTSAGQKVILPLADETELFVATDISCEQLLGSAAVSRYQSTLELVQGLQNASFSVVATRTHVLQLHERLTRPLLNLLAVCLAVPLVLKKESFSLITNLAVCAVVMVGLLGVEQVGFYLGRMNWLPQDLAIWLPIIVSGTLTAWFFDRVQT